jgi:hypothetical protein
MRCLVIFAILLTGCGQSAKSSRPAVARKPYVSTWKPPLESAPKAPPAPVVPPPPPPPDPAVEQRKAEAARRNDEERKRRATEKEFAALPSAEKRRIQLTRDALNAKGLNNLGVAELTVIHLHLRHFPTVSPADLTQALAAWGDEKGASDHLASLGITDPDASLKLRATFGLTPDATCDDAVAASEEIGRLGLAGASDRVKAFVARNPKLFPQPSTTTSRAP